MAAAARRRHRREPRSGATRRRRHLADRRSRAGLVVLGTLGGLALLVRYDPVTGALLTPGTAQAGTTAAIGAAPVAAGTQVLGRVVQTDFGHFQVALTVAGGRIVGSRAVLLPEDGGKTGERINAWAVPVLNAQTLKSQSATIDGVSGATISSNGYRQSLQSAIDAAHL